MPGADEYFADGCGRCEYGGTPQCKVHLWDQELQLLRSLILACGLKETRKWGVPCYTHQNKNVILLGAFKTNCVISFLNGHLLNDPKEMLELPGPNSKEDRVMRFRGIEEIKEKAQQIQEMITQAVQISASGKKSSAPKQEAVIPEELKTWFVRNPELQTAFYALTPGRQRGYLIHFSQPVQSATRSSRIEKCIPHILAGKGRQDP